MNYGNTIYKRFLPVLIVGMAMISCDTPSPASLFDENYQPLTPPVISEVLPEGKNFAGYQEVIINGQNFDTTPGKMFVFFNDVRANIVSATSTQIVVRTPNLVADSVGIKISVLGVEAFSNSYRYRLESLFQDYVEFATSEAPWGATLGPDNTLYVSMELSLVPNGIKTFGADGTVLAENHVPAQSWFYRSMKVGPDGGLYMVRGGAIPTLYRVAPAGGAPTNWRGGIGRTEDVAFGGGFAWTGGTNETNATNARINRVAPDAVLTRFPFVAQIFALHYHEGSLYVAGTRADVSYVWRLPIQNDNTPGAEVVVANLTDAGVPGRPTAITVAADGTVLVGMNGAKPLYEVSTTGVITELYPDIIPGNILKMEYIPNSERVLMTLLSFDGSAKNRLIWLNVQRAAP